MAHYHTPGSIEQLVQESGRAGRDGRRSDCILLFAPEDLQIQRALQARSRPRPQQLRRVAEALSAWAEEDKPVSSDALALSERLEAKLEAHPGNVRRAAVELARDWRTDRILRRLEAMLLVGDGSGVLVVSGNGDVIEPDDGIAAIGSGGSFALSAARALSRNTDLSAEEIARKALEIAAEICIYTNDRIHVETLP